VYAQLIGNLAAGQKEAFEHEISKINNAIITGSQYKAPGSESSYTLGYSADKADRFAMNRYNIFIDDGIASGYLKPTNYNINVGKSNEPPNDESLILPEPSLLKDIGKAEAATEQELGKLKGKVPTFKTQAQNLPDSNINSDFKINIPKLNQKDIINNNNSKGGNIKEIEKRLTTLRKDNPLLIKAALNYYGNMESLVNVVHKLGNAAFEPVYKNYAIN
jgi:hypothetical protein